MTDLPCSTYCYGPDYSGVRATLTDLRGEAVGYACGDPLHQAEAEKAAAGGLRWEPIPAGLTVRLIRAVDGDYLATFADETAAEYTQRLYANGLRAHHGGDAA
jgi:hypothetical protein